MENQIQTETSDKEDFLTKEFTISTEELESLLKQTKNLFLKDYLKSDDYLDLYFKDYWYTAKVISIQPSSLYEVMLFYPGNEPPTASIPFSEQLSFFLSHPFTRKEPIHFNQSGYSTNITLDNIPNIITKISSLDFETPYELIQYYAGYFIEILECFIFTIKEIDKYKALDLLMTSYQLIKKVLHFVCINPSLVKIFNMNRMLMLLDKRFALIAISEVLIQQIGKFWNFYEELYCEIPSKYIDTMYTQLQIEHYFDKSKEAVEYQITDPNDNPLTLKAIMFMYSYIQHIGIINELESILTNASQINNFPMLYLNGLYEQLIALYNIDYSLSENSFDKTNEFKENLQKVLKVKFLEMSEKELKETRIELIEECIHNVVSLFYYFSSFDHENNTAKIILNFTFNGWFVIRCLQSENLEKRIYAMNYINNKIESPIMLFHQLLYKFIIDEKIMNLLLGDNIHDELLKRSINIFSFMAEYSFENMDEEDEEEKNNEHLDEFPDEIIDLLWDNYLTKHESISSQIKIIICKISYYLPFNKKQHLYKRFKNVASQLEKSSPIEYLVFLTKLTKGCLRHANLIKLKDLNEIKTNEGDLYGIPVIYNNLISSQNVNEIEEYSNNLLQILNSSDSLRGDFLNKMISLLITNIIEKIAVVQSIQLLIKIYCKCFKSKPQEREQSLSNIDKIYSIIDLAVNDLCLYLKAKNDNFNNYNSNSNKLYSTKANIETRLNFIFFTHTQNGIHTYRLDIIGERHLKPLFQSFASVSEKERNWFYIYITNHQELLERELKEYLFRDILMNEELFSPKELTKEGLEMFENIFYAFHLCEDNNSENSQDERIYLLERDSRNNIHSAVANVEGIDFFYKVLMTNQNEIVTENSIHILKSLCLHPLYYSESFTSKYWPEFMQNLINNLKLSYKSDNSKALNNLIKLLYQIYFAVTYEGPIPDERDTESAKSPYLLYQFSYPGKRDFKVNVSEFQTVLDIRWRLGYYYDLPINTIIFSTENKDKQISILNDNEYFRTFFTPKQQIIVSTRPNGLLETLSQNPKILLDQDKELDNIFWNLLHNSNAEYIDNVWHMLNRNSECNLITEQITSIGNSKDKNEININALFDMNSIYVIAFTLNNISSYLDNYPEHEDNFLNTFISIYEGDAILTKIFLSFTQEQFTDNKIALHILFKCTLSLLDLLIRIINSKIQNSIDINALINQAITFVGFIPIIQNKHSVHEDQITLLTKLLYLINYLCNLKQVDFLDILMNETHSNVTFKSLYVHNYITKTKKDVRNLLNNYLHTQLEKDKKLVNKYFNIVFTNDTFDFIKENKSSYYFREMAIYLDKFYNAEIMQEKLIQVTDNIFSMLKTFTSNEEQLILGLLILLKSILKKCLHSRKHVLEKYNIIDIILNECLLSKCKEEPLKQLSPKCSSSSSQEITYEILTLLCQNDDKDFSLKLIQEIVTVLTKYHTLGFWKTHLKEDWLISLYDDIKNEFVGLKNLGAICYINSIIQQLFMIGEMRNTIMSINTKEQGVLFQLKQLFYGLSYYESQYVNMKAFCEGYDEKKLDFYEQMDATEFYGQLIDKLEVSLKDYPQYNNFLKYLFGGVYVDELLFKDCGHKRENQFFFNSLELQVSGKKSLEDSLVSYVQGESMEGSNCINCEECNKKVPSVKRQVMKYLPRILVLALKRFEFDYDKLARNKLNDYFPFPMELDMFPYTQEYKPNDTNNKKILYDLIGVVIHMGSSERGHYYSLIKEQSSQKWYEFNDKEVTPFNLRDLEKEAFGGKEEAMNRKGFVDKHNNAYMLIYSVRDKNEPIVNHFNSEVVSNLSQPDIKFINKINNEMFHFWVLKNITTSEYQSFVIKLAKINILQYSRKLNCRNMRLNSYVVNKYSLLPQRTNAQINENVFKEDDEEEINELIVVNDDKTTFDLFVFIATYYLNIVIRCRDKSNFHIFTDIIKVYINTDETKALWILEEFLNEDIILEFLRDSPNSQMSNLIVGVIYCAMLKLSQSENKEKFNQISYTYISKLFILIFDSLTDLIPVLFLSKLLYRIVSFNEKYVSFLKSNDICSLISSSYLETQTTNNYHNTISSTLSNLKITLIEPSHSILKSPSTSKKEYIKYRRFHELPYDSYLISLFLLSIDSDKLIHNLFDQNEGFLIHQINSNLNVMLLCDKIYSHLETNIKLYKQFLLLIFKLLNGRKPGQMFFYLSIIKRLAFMYPITSENRETRMEIIDNVIEIISSLMDNTDFTNIYVLYQFIISINHNHFSLLVEHKENLREKVIDPMIQYLIRYKMYNSRAATRGYKNKSQAQRKAEEKEHENKMNMMINNLKNVCEKKNDAMFPREEILNDFVFVEGDIVVYKDNSFRVIDTLDEMIKIEQIPNDMKGKYIWVETDDVELILKKAEKLGIGNI